MKLTIILILIITSFIIFNSKVLADNYITLNYNTDKGINLDELYLEKTIKDYNLQIGKKHINLKDGDFLRLLINDQAPSLPMIYFNKKYKYFTGETAISFISESVNRKLFIHRLTNKTLIKDFQIGISEAVIVHENINPFYYIPQPYIPYYLIKKISGIYDQYNYYDDSYIGIDFIYDNNNFMAYGELLVDEYPYQDFATNPDKRAHLVGLKIPIKNKYWFNIEYSNVYAGVYEHRFKENNYKYFDEYLGHRYGPDTVEYNMEFGIVQNQYKYIFSFANIKNGPNDMNGVKNVGDGGILLNEVVSEINEYSIKYQLNKDKQYYEFELKYIDNIYTDNNEFKFDIKAKYKF